MKDINDCSIDKIFSDQSQDSYRFLYFQYQLQQSQNCHELTFNSSSLSSSFGYLDRCTCIEYSRAYITITFVMGIIVGWLLMASSSTMINYVYVVKNWIKDTVQNRTMKHFSHYVKQEEMKRDFFTRNSPYQSLQQQEIEENRKTKMQTQRERRIDDEFSFSRSRTDDTISKIHEIENIDNVNDDDAEYEVLKHAILLFVRQFFYSNDCSFAEQNLHNIMAKKKQIKSTDKVVDYKSPRDMANALFHNSSSKKVFSMSLKQHHYQKEGNIETKSSIQQMNHLFEQIQNYSVQTSHPFFFNQLFGALDPIALAAEIIALSAHTSAYTWETAPVFTLIEREVIGRLSQLVFERKGIYTNENGNRIINEIDKVSGNLKEDDDVYNDLINSKYDGLMLPGGSLSNLTAIHVARHYSLHGIEHNSQRVEKNQVDLTLDISEEKKEQQECMNKSQVQLVAFVSSEAHYSFTKAASVTGIGVENLISVPTLQNGQMDVEKLDLLMTEFHDFYPGSETHRIPFFIAATAGSTVRGSFDDIDAIVKVCQKHEEIINRRLYRTCHKNNVFATDNTLPLKWNRCKIWVHVDGAWGGSAIFSSRADMRQLLHGVQNVDSFTFNPHKLMGATQQTTAFISRHKGILKAANSSGAKYLFDSRKNGAECDLGDASYTCGRRSDAIKLWALWKYYGCKRMGQMMEMKADSLSLFARMIQDHDSFMLACSAWPFNVNFFYLTKRIRSMLKVSKVDIRSENPVIPDKISKELAIVSVKLKLRLHQSGVMLIPYQPLSNQKADCFRLVLAGKKVFSKHDYEHVIEVMEKFGSELE